MDGIVRTEGGDGDDEFGGKRGVCDELLSFRVDLGGVGWKMSMCNVDLNRLGSSSLEESGSDHQSGSAAFGSNVVEELTVNNCGVGVANVSGTGGVDGLTEDGLNGKRSQWQHLYVSRSRITGDQGHVVLNAREGLKRMSSGNQNLNLTSGKCCTKDPDEVSAQLMSGYNKIISNGSLPQEQLRRKTLVSPLLTQFYASKVNKGKGVIDSEQYLQCRLASPNMECQDVDESSIKNECSSQSLRSTEVLPRRLFNTQVSLRIWLKPGRYKHNKIESLDIYRKILELVDATHTQGFILGKLRPSYFILEFPNKVKYIGHLSQATDNIKDNGMSKKRLFADDLSKHQYSSSKLQKVNVESSAFHPRYNLKNNSGSEPVAEVNFGNVNQKINPTHLMTSVSSSMEEQWYSSPDEQNGMGCSYSSNTYALGVLFFELLCCSRTSELLSATMMNLRHRVLPPTLLSENPKEVGFSLWLLHPDASLRPSISSEEALSKYYNQFLPIKEHMQLETNTLSQIFAKSREILESDVICQHQKVVAVKAADLPVDNGLAASIEIEDNESEMLLHFLTTMKEQKENQVSMLIKNLEFLDTDVKDVERRHVERMPFVRPEKVSSTDQSKPSNAFDKKPFAKNKQLDDAYLSIRSKMQKTEPDHERPDKDVLTSTGNWLMKRRDNETSCMKDNPRNELGFFFEGLCKYATYNKLEERGTLRSGDLLNSVNVVCSLSFDRDEDFIATALVSKKIKIFGFDALLDDSIEIHYPVAEMSNKSMLSCVCWNSYIKNYLASTDYDGNVQIWDADTNQAFCQYAEHQKRAWSVDFSKVDPRKFATGSDDYLVKIWSINERNSTITIRNPANICCVQFSDSSPNLVAFGSADYKLYCYDLRHTRIPWCTLADHERTVSHLKFLDSDTIVSASTDNTLKLWDLKKTSPTGVSSNACSLTYKGHTNLKNFVGLSVSDGFIACGSETNEVFTYHMSLPMPITSYKFSAVDPISGRKMSDDYSQFVSSLCWRRKSNMILAANSKGNIKLLQMV